MTTTSSQPGPGGFLEPTLPSPPPSSAHSTSTTTSFLPQPRSTPLKSGTPKQSSFIDYVDRKLLGISRRYEKRYNTDFEDEPSPELEGRGYEGFRELASDMEGVIDVVWVSGTPSLQTPYLLTIALTTCSYLPSFPFSPRATFQLLRKLDLAFCSLLRGANVETGEVLPGFQGGRGKLSTTEKVRMRGLVERSRVTVVELAGKRGSVTEGGISSQTEDDLTTENEDEILAELQVEGNHGRWEMEIARVYEKTIVELGIALETAEAGSSY